jgi:two-component system cell cycle response regulator
MIQSEALMTGAAQEKLDISILYVEDELVARRMVTGILQRRFSIVYQAKDGKEGLESFRQHGPDIVVTDSRMPEMDGIEMAKAIKVISPETPIIFTSAYADIEFMEKLEQIGIAGSIVKPIVVKELLNMLEKVGSAVAARAHS